jgi:hypothetical protein
VNQELTPEAAIQELQRNQPHASNIYEWKNAIWLWEFGELHQVAVNKADKYEDHFYDSDDIHDWLECHNRIVQP